MLRFSVISLSMVVTFLALATPGVGLVAQLSGQSSYDVIEGIQYNTLDSNQTVTAYLPSASARRPTTLFVVNYGSGNKAPLLRRFAERGFAVFFANVRRRASYPEPVQDVFCALAWLHAKATDYDVDPARIVAMGHSGGAVLAAHLGTVENKDLYVGDCPHSLPPDHWLQGVVAIAGIFDYRTEEEFGAPHNNYTPRYFGGTQAEVPDVWAEASPITWVDGTEPPFFVVHGTDDTMVRPIQSERSATMLRDAGVNVELLLVQGANHDTVLEERVFAAVETFLDRLDADEPERD